MKYYSFSNLTVHPFPTIADLNNPWIFGGVQVLINVSCHDYPKEILDAIESKGIRWYHFGGISIPILKWVHVFLKKPICVLNCLEVEHYSLVNTYQVYDYQNTLCVMDVLMSFLIWIIQQLLR